jgi:hypothetical protein
VDAAGAATTTWRNASSVRFLGATVAATLRQTGRLAGTLSASVYRERHDAGNLSGGFRRQATNWSAGGNATFKATRSVDLQGYLRYSPAQTLAQGRSSAFAFTYLGVRQKIGDPLVINLMFRDPFNLARWSTSTGDATYTQTSTSHNSLRGVSGSLTWTWGKPPEQKPRRQNAEPQAPEAPGQGH